MRIDLQFVRLAPRGFESFDSADWPFLARDAGPVPEPGRGVSTARLNGRPEYAGLVNIQGVHATADHQAVEHLSDGRCRLYLWQDDPEDWAPGEFIAHVIEFAPPLPNPQIAGRAWNTWQLVTVYGGDDVLRFYDRLGPVETTAGPVSVRPWHEFRPPDADHVLHGIWVPDALWATHERLAFARLAPWMEWLPDRAVYAPAGPLHHSRTFLFNAPDGNDSDCSSVQWDIEKKMAESGQTSTAYSVNFGGGVTKISHVFTSEAGDPGVADWPAASGGDPYRCSMNVTACGANITFGLLGGGENGGFHRVSSSCSRDETVEQEESAFTGTGVASANNTTWDPGGSTTSRYQVRIRGVAGSFHGQEALEITTDSSSFAQGPWSGATTIAVGLAQETDTAFALAAQKRRAPGLASEADSGFAVGAAKQASVALASEADSPFAVLRSKALTAGLALEVDTGLALVAPLQIPVGLATEADSGLATIAAKSLGIDDAQEISTAFPLARAKAAAVGLALEADTGLATLASKLASIGLATETATALALAIQKTLSPGLASEVDTAFPVSSGGTIVVGLASELDSALATAAAKLATLGLVLEVNQSFAVTAVKSNSAGLAAEADAALAPSIRKTLAVVAAESVESALGVAPVRVILVDLAQEIDTAFSLPSAAVQALFILRLQVRPKLAARVDMEARVQGEPGGGAKVEARRVGLNKGD